MRTGVRLALAGMALAAPLHAQRVEYPQPVTRDDAGDWTVECYAPEERECQLYQRVVTESGAIAMVVTFAWDPGVSALRTQIAVPLGVDLAGGSELTIRPGFSATLPFARCTQQGCLMEGQVTGSFLEALRGGESGTLTVIDPTSGEFAIPISLAGFDDGLARIVPDGALPPAPGERPDTLAPVTGDP